MIRRISTSIFFLAMLTGLGCQSAWTKKDDFSAARVSEPPLAESMTKMELVDFLNRQNQDLNGWRSTSTKMEVKFPRLPRQKLTGSIACQSPNYFRLLAGNLIATADLGSNNQRCWVYSKPGEGAVMTWRHEDTPLLQQVPTGVPYIDPNWLMLVLGVTPLNADDYSIRPAHGNQLWLTAVEDSPSGRPIRRIIKVDRSRRVVREHAIYDSEANLLVSAALGNYRWADNTLIPHHVTLSFPRMESEIRLTFQNVETNPHLPDGLWHLPNNDLQVVDLGDVIRSRMMPNGSHSRLNSSDASVAQVNQPYQPPQIQLQQPDFNQTSPFTSGQSRSAFADSSSSTSQFDGMPVAGESSIPEPDWSTNPISHRRQLDDDFNAGRTAPRKRGFFDRFAPFRR